MRLALDTDPHILLVRRYGEGELLIGNERVTRPCLVSPERLLQDWGVGRFAQLAEWDEQSGVRLEPLLEFGAGIVLIGAGGSQLLPSRAMRERFRARALALECMNLGAACRTYNILATEQRSVVAALFP